MTNTELIAKIKDFANEQKELLNGFELQSDFRRGETTAYSAIISFLSTIESEKPNQDELEKEIEAQLSVFPYTKVSPELPESRLNVIRKVLYMFARHFAQWQKEQMMKKAVEGEVHPDDCEIWVNLVGYGYKFNDGDKVRIIIVKEDEK